MPKAKTQHIFLITYYLFAKLQKFFVKEYLVSFFLYFCTRFEQTISNQTKKSTVTERAAKAMGAKRSCSPQDISAAERAGRQLSIQGENHQMIQN